MISKIWNVYVLILVLTVSNRAFGGESVSWVRHSWNLPVHIMKREMLLSETVYRDFLVSAPISARNYGENAQRGVCLILSEDTAIVVSSQAKVDLLAVYDEPLRVADSLSGIREIAETIEKRREVTRWRREISRGNGDKIVSIWRNAIKRCTFRPVPVYNSVWSIGSETSDGDVTEFDVSGVSPGPPVDELLKIAGVLIDYSRNRITEVRLMQVIESGKSKSMGSSVFPAVKPTGAGR